VEKFLFCSHKKEKKLIFNFQTSTEQQRARSATRYISRRRDLSRFLLFTPRVKASSSSSSGSRVNNLREWRGVVVAFKTSSR